MLTHLIEVQVDFREIPSGIPELLRKISDAVVSISNLPSGDYIINEAIGVERKSQEDFIQSLVSGRLFAQIARLKRCFPRPLLIIEGGPYYTSHKVHDQAIRGALISITVAWQMPVMFSRNQQETAEMLIMIGRQEIASSFPSAIKGIRQRRKSGKHLSFLQSLPGIGPQLSARLLERMGSLKAVINATPKELMQTAGIGRHKARQFVEFVNACFSELR